MKEITLKGQDNLDLAVFVYDDVKNPIGVVQLVHGSCEHSQRYTEFIEYLNSNDYIVVASDHRGHGKTAQLQNTMLGFFAPNDGWNILIDDLKVINDYIHQNYGDLKITMMGHSMGSFMVRTYLIKYGSTINKAILSGTAWYNPFLMKYAIWFARKRKKKYGQYFRDDFIWSLSYKSFNKKWISHNSTGNEWLSIDEENRIKFSKDLTCGFMFTSTAFLDMFLGIVYNQKRKNMKHVPKDIPVLLISGEDDPVGAFKKGVKKTKKSFDKQKIKTEMIFYKDLRHEIVFDRDKELVFKDVLNFLKS
ncbi:alpha/beta fold hydrolase [Spiroplasma culicicola]|uniref:Lysophospholipase n=1 Tax=Spiroplasma culicicola AES-1 TaxID=1276246 RepID=W6A7L3_9MOLU|nr:alpha/beta hydrolase [Spiroplasma culicicola]AHI52971.1 lysophospholipase [Spiroplasma culicicola AES-1]